MALNAKDGNSYLKRIGQLAVPIGHGIILQPFTTCRILMHLGFEPDPPFRGHSLLSLLGMAPKSLKLPSIFTYSSRVAEKVGWSGLLFIGLPAKLCYTTLSSIVTDKVYNHITKDEKNTTKKLFDTDKPFKEYFGELTIVAAARISGIIISYPIEVIMIRQMAQILDDNVGGTSSMLTWFITVLKEEGLVGFYGGVSSKIFGDILSLSTAAVLVYGINNFVLSSINNKEIEDYTPSIANIIASPVSHKFTVISTLLAVSGSKLMYAIPFKGFLETYEYLRKERGFGRGSSLLLRYAP